MLSEPQERLFEDPNFNIAAARLHRSALAEHDMTLVLMIAGDAGGARPGRPVRHARGHVDGALLVSTHAGDPLLDELRARGRPGRRLRPPARAEERDLAYVAADDRDGARQMVQLPASTRAADGSA